MKHDKYIQVTQILDHIDDIIQRETEYSEAVWLDVKLAVQDNY